MYNIKILGTGKKIPIKIINNHDLEKIIYKNDEWIYNKTGIKTRHIIKDTNEYINLITESAIEAIKNSKLNYNDINLVILATSTPTNLFGGVSNIISKLNIKNAISFDITLACNGFNIAFYTAYQYIKNGTCTNALIIGADCLSRWVDWSDYKTSILFGDGAGAVVIGRSNDIGYGFIKYYYKQDCSKHNILNINVKEKENIINNICVKNNYYDLMYMNGREVFNFVIDNIPSFIIESLEQEKLSINDIKYIIPHQANKNILNLIAEKLNISQDKILSNIEKYGNTSSASIPILLQETIENNIFIKGDLILLLGFGAGMSSSIIIFKY